MSASCQNLTAVGYAGRSRRWSISLRSRPGSDVFFVVASSAYALIMITGTVLMLITSSNLVGCWTGRSAGFLAAENAINIHRGSAVQAVGAYAEGHQTAVVWRSLARRSPLGVKQLMTKPASVLPVTPSDIDQAAQVLAPFAVRTPLLSSPALDQRTGAKVFIKPEMLQRTGSFKFRGAFNKLSSIPQA